MPYIEIKDKHRCNPPGLLSRWAHGVGNGSTWLCDSCHRQWLLCGGVWDRVMYPFPRNRPAGDGGEGKSV